MKSIYIIFVALVLLFMVAMVPAQTLYRMAPYSKPQVRPHEITNPSVSAVPVDQNIQVYATNHYQTEFTVAAHPTDYTKLVIGANTDIGQGYYYTTNAGLNWSGGDDIPGVGVLSSDPAVAFDANGNVFFNYLESFDGGYTYRLEVRKSTNTGSTWGSAVEVPTNGSNDKPHFTADQTSGSPYANYLYSGCSDWTQTHPPIIFSRSTNGGTSFTSFVNISGSNTGNVSQGVNFAVSSGGTLYAIWAIFDGAQNNGESGIGFNKSTNGGSSWVGSSRILNIQGTFNSSGWTNHNPNGTAVRVNSFPSMAVDRSGGTYNGYIYVVWADKRYDHSDILLSRSTNGGTNWSTPIRVNTDTQGNGKDQWMPWVSVSPDGIVTVGFFDSRNDPNNMKVEFWTSYSSDGGATFRDYRVIDPWRWFYWYPVPGTNYAGDYNGIACTKQFAFPCWADPRVNGTTLQAYISRFGVYINNATVYGAWQMTSLPGFMHDTSLAVVYPTRTASNVTWYDVCNGYVNEDPLWFTGGYWVKFGAQQTISYMSQPVYNYPMTVQVCGTTPSWNMIGSISKSVSTASIVQNPANNVSSYYFRTNSSGGYVQTTTVDPGNGIWVKVNQFGTLTYSATPPKVENINPFADLDKFTISDQKGGQQEMFVRNGTNHFKKEAGVTTEGNVELPPPGPAGFFDIRFNTGNYVQVVRPDEGVKELPIDVRDVQYPLTFKWNTLSQNGMQYNLVVNGERMMLGNKGTYTIKQPGTISIEAYAGTSPIVTKPAEYSLEQNYPNPFNPMTNISYSLPEKQHVRLSIYDLLGREVAQLVNETQDAGLKTVRFDASSLPSGVYYYTLQAGKYVDTKKMLITK